MAFTNQERVGKAMELLKDGLTPFVERELKNKHAQRLFEEAKAAASEMQATFLGTAAPPKWDVASLLGVMWDLRGQRRYRKAFEARTGKGESQPNRAAERAEATSVPPESGRHSDLL